MAQPQRKSNSNPDIRPDLHAIDGGGESTPDRAKLGVVEDLQSRESEGNVIQGPWGSKPEGDDGSSEDVRDAEDSGGNWKSSYGGNKSKSGKGITKANFTAVLKKRGPLAAIITLVCGGGVGIGLFFGPSLLLVQIQEAILDKYDSQNTSMTIRSDKLIANKITGDATSGSCNIVQIACRFSRPSNKLLTNLAANGVEAYDKDGNIVTKTGLFQTTRPVRYTFEGKDILAKDFSSTLSTNAKFRAAFHSAYNPRFAAFSDKIFNLIKTRFGFDTSDKNSDGSTKESTVVDDLNESSKQPSAVAGEADEGAEGLLKKLISAQASKMIAKIAQGGKGDTVGLVAAGVCAVGDIPSLFTSTIRAYQMVQLILYAMPFLTAGSELKAGTLTPEKASQFGSLLTTEVGGKSAMDSVGMQDTMFGASETSSDSGYKKFSPGASVISSLGNVNQVLNSQAKKDTCNVATNPATGQGLNIALAANSIDTLGTSLLAAGINIVVGYALSSIVESLVAPMVSALLSSIDFTPLLEMVAGNLTQNLAGEDVGDALVSGASNMLSQTANAGGNMPLSVADAVAYNQSTQDVNVAYAQEDRATLSPLDPTSPNTVVGSIVSGLLPYLSNMGSISGIFSSLASIPGGSLSSLLNTFTANAASTTADYSMCADPSITDAGVAAGPFCNVYYGIPPQYLNMDPQTIVDSLVASGDVDPTTGDPIDKGDTESLNRWVNTCTDGATDQLKNCEIVDDKTAMYSLYTIDHRIQETMDDPDDAVLDPNTSSTTTDTSSSSTDSSNTGSTDTQSTDNSGDSTTQSYIYSQPSTVAYASSTNTSGGYSIPTSLGWYWSVG